MAAATQSIESYRHEVVAPADTPGTFLSAAQHLLYTGLLDATLKGWPSVTIFVSERENPLVVTGNAPYPSELQTTSEVIADYPDSQTLERELRALLGARETVDRGGFVFDNSLHRDDAFQDRESHVGRYPIQWQFERNSQGWTLAMRVGEIQTPAT